MCPRVWLWCGRPSAGAFRALFWISVLVIISANYKLIAMLTDWFLARTLIAKSSWTCSCLWRFVTHRNLKSCHLISCFTVKNAVMFKKPPSDFALIATAQPNAHILFINCRCQWLKWLWLANRTLKSAILNIASGWTGEGKVSLATKNSFVRRKRFEMQCFCTSVCAYTYRRRVDHTMFNPLLPPPRPDTRTASLMHPECSNDAPRLFLSYLIWL